MPTPLTSRSLKLHARRLASDCPHLNLVYQNYGPPPLWDRQPGFATLLQIILEQQVSLASAKACYDKLGQRVGEITPRSLLASSDTQLRNDGFSRQKAAYARHLAQAVLEGRLDFESLGQMTDEEAKAALIQLKGVGQWTSDIYLLMAMLRPDVMPKGDVALHTAWHKLSGEPRPSADEFLITAERWKPYRSVAARMLWHFYLSER
jgi:DNA-3-methyladenine glycosylase II